MYRLLISLAGWVVLSPLAISAEIAVSGKVIDETGAVVAGARIELQASSAESSVVAFSSPTGSFSLTIPAPGDYIVRASRQGFYLVNERPRAFAPGSASLTITLNHQTELAEQIDVVYSPPDIELQQPSEHTELDHTQIEGIPYPAAHDYRNSLPLLNGVVLDTAGRVHFEGASSSQTSYSLDGFHLNDPVTGRLEARLNIDSIRSLDVDTSRIPADEGRGTAGTLDVKTKMGDDRLRFGATNFLPGVTTEQGFHFNKWTPRLEISGPLYPGRVWFYDGYDTFYNQDVVHGLPKGQNRTSDLNLSNLARLQVNLTPANILTASFLLNHSRRTRLGLDFLDPVETTTTNRGNLYFTNLRDQVYLGNGALVEIGFADTRGTLLSRPQGTVLFQITPSGSRGNYFVDTDRHYYRQEWLASAVLPQFHAAGTHQLKAGIDLERDAFHQEVLRHDYEVLRVDQSVARYVTFSGSPFEQGRNLSIAPYLVERWAPHEGLLIEAGVRGEWSQIVRDFNWGPRVAAAWAPGRSRNLKISAGYGIYYDALPLGIVTSQQNQQSLSTFYPPGLPPRGPVLTAFTIDQHLLTVPRSRNASVGVERMLPFKFHGRATWLLRRGSHEFTFVPPAGGTGVFRLANTRRDRYDAFELALRRTFAGHFEWFGGYTRSSARTSAVVDYSLENPIFAPQMAGPVAWDAPHRFLTWGWAPLPSQWLPGWMRVALRNTDAQYLLEYRTGFPFNVVNDEAALVGRADGRRYPTYFNINLHLERRFTALHYLWAWRFGFNNLTANSNPNTVNNNIDSPMFLTYGRGQARAFTVRLRFLGRR